MFERYARHVNSGEKMPADLQERMRKASLFNKGYDMTELLGAALLDMRWHMLEKSVAEQSVAEFEQQALAAEHLDLPAVPPAIAAVILPISSAAATQRDTTPTCGRKC